MKRTDRLGEATAPDGTVLTLLRRDDVYTLRVRGVELMSTRRSHSEERLAEAGCLALRDAPAPRVLIGGLGFGFTLRAALRILPPDAAVTVAEIVPEIVAWNRDPELALAYDALADPRVAVHLGDVAELIRASEAAWDAVLLDVDNGAEALTTGGNADLYRAAGVRAAIRALRPGGRLVYWSADDDPRFARLLRDAGLVVEEVRVRAHATTRGTHSLLVGQLPAAPRSGTGAQSPSVHPAEQGTEGGGA